MIAASPVGLRAVVVRARAWARAQAVVYGTSITAVLGSIRNTQCACATRWIVPLTFSANVKYFQIGGILNGLPQIVHISQSCTVGSQ